LGEKQKVSRDNGVGVDVGVRSCTKMRRLQQETVEVKVGGWNWRLELEVDRKR